MGINWNNINRSGARAARRSNPEPGSIPKPKFQERRVFHDKFGHGTEVLRVGNVSTVMFTDGVTRKICSWFLS